MATYILGVRHHGPGSARRVVERLEALRPDLILVEGPPEAEELRGRVAEAEMTPPVALLAYEPTCPQNAVFYPFATFSPEWQAMRYAVSEGVELHFFDLPLIYSLARSEAKNEDTPEAEPTEEPEPSEPEHTYQDPFDALAEIDDLPDGEAWWDLRIESSPDGAEAFEAVAEAVRALRETFPERTRDRDRVREAWMRRQLREAERGDERVIVVICGAWHVPALEARAKVKVKDDNELLKGLAKTKVSCTWIPWTYDRLSLDSGYGAGIAAPGWYDYLWHHPEDDGTLWVSRMAQLLRQRNMDISVAHVIEVVRLAHATAALKGHPRALLEDYNEAAVAIMGFGDPILLELIDRELVISDRLGSVPDDVPKVPLLVDVEREQKRLRLPFTSEIKAITLDLRKPLDLEKSVLLHRMALLDIGWGQVEHASGKGTFKEQWRLHHQPEQIVKIIERAVWGNTLRQATEGYLIKQALELQQISRLTQLLYEAIPADLPGLIERMTQRLDELSASSLDVLELMQSIPGMVRIVRYGSVRDLDFSRLEGMLRVMVARSLAGGVQAASGIDEEAAASVYEDLIRVDQALTTLADKELREQWLAFLEELRTASQAHPMLRGLATRLLNQADSLPSEEVARSLAYYSSVGMKPADMAYWLEGFLRSSSTLLLLEDRLWELVNDWICAQSADTFCELLPVMRRTFADFSTAERRKLGEKARRYDGQTTSHRQDTSSVEALDSAEAARVLPLIDLFLGLH